MKKLILTGVAVLSLAACATGPTAYGPASTGGGFGFNNTQIENDRFRISYTGRSPEEAHDYALLRASEIALAEGYSHFKVLHGEIYGDDRGRGNVSSSIGIGVGSGRGGYYGRRRSSTNVGVGIGIHDLGRALNGDKYTSTVEVILKRSGSGTEDDGRIYNARSVNESIRPPVFQ